MKGLLKWISGQGKQKKQAQEEFYNQVNAMFPTEAHAHTAERMQNMLPRGDLNPSQYKSVGYSNPWQMSQPAWTDMMSTQEGLSQEQVAQLHSDYYKMNNLPDVLNTTKNIDMLIHAASYDKYDKY